MKRGARHFFAGTVLMLASAAGLLADQYTIGEGVRLADTPYYLGGYFSTVYWHDLEGSSEISLDEAAAMLYGSTGAWSTMAEFELSDAYRRRFGPEEEESSDLTLHVERLYARYEPTGRWDVTLGKFNTPVGFWNRMPINVLRDTTSNPEVVYRIFPRFTTGVDIRLNSGSITFNLLGQATPDLDKAFNGDRLYSNFDIERQGGIGLQYERGSWTLGVNAGSYKEHSEDETWHFGYVSAEYRSEKRHLLAETGYRRNKSNTRSSFGAYLQGTQTLASRHYAVMRLEYTTDFEEATDDSAAIVGYTYRPVFPVALKAEYQFHSRSEDNKLLCSFSVLF